MNKERRKRINDIIDRLNDIQSEVVELQEEEQDAYDCLPESIQESERGEAMMDAVDNLESAASNLEDAVSYLEEATV